MKKFFPYSIFVFVAASIATPLVALAINQTLKLNVPLGDTTEINLTGEPLYQYLSIWYGFIIGTVGILATVMIMWAGIKWLTSRGNSATIGDAKEKIWSAIIGLMLAFLSFTILYLINPALTVMKTPRLGDLGTGGANDAPSPTTPGPEDQLNEPQQNDGRTSINQATQNTTANNLASNNINIGQNVRVDQLTPNIINAARNLQGGCNCPLDVTSGYRPDSTGSQHQSGNALDFSRGNEQFNNFMQNTIIGNSQPVFYYRGQPAYRVEYGGINMTVINETTNNCWHVDVRQ